MEKEPYGDVEYADPGYQSDKKKRYPINTEEHARAAWSYINKAGNASAYSSEELAKVKAKIRAACKKFGIEIRDDEHKASQRYTGDIYVGAIECRTAVELSGLVNNEITYLPAGLHSITPVGGGIGRPINVLVDRNSAQEIQNQFLALCAKGKRPWFDFNHDDNKSSFWPSNFIWRDGDGVVACGEWTESGKAAVRGKDYRAFSPVFYVDNKLGAPAKVVCRENAKPNMGGLVNDPAFHNLPLWAKNDGSSVNAGVNNGDHNKRRNNGMTTDIAALRAKSQELENQLEALKTVPDPAMAEPEIKAAEAERELILAQIRNAELQNELDEKNKAIASKREAEADAAVARLVAGGVILSQDGVARKKYKEILVNDPGFERTAMQTARRDLTSRLIGSSSITVVNDDPQKILCKITQLSAQQFQSRNRDEKMAIAREVAAIYAKEITPGFRGSLAAANSNRIIGYPLRSVNDALAAGDNIDGNLGTLSGTLVSQRVLELLKFTFPALTSFTTDFTDQPAQFNQTIQTRTVTVPTVSSYSTASGWTDSTAATTDVPVTINNHKGVPITFNENILQSTVRRLFDEFAEAQAYALGKDMVEALYANITDANFTNNTVIASASFARNTCVDIQNALNKRGVPFMGRTLLLYSDAFAALQKDSTMVTFAAFAAPDIVKQGQDQIRFVIPVAGFEVLTAPDLPTNNGNVNGFAGSKSALIIATRVPNDYTSVLPGASFGNVSMVTDPDIGITVMQAQYVNHQLGTATSRISLMYGTAAGQGNAGQLVKANTGSGSSH